MATNSFKKLAEEVDNQYPHAPPEVENNLMGNMRMTHFVGNVVELYLPRLFDMILALFGSSTPSVSAPEANDPLKRDSDDAPEGSSKSDSD